MQGVSKMFQAYFNGRKSALYAETSEDLRDKIARIEQDFGMSQFGFYNIYEMESHTDAPNEECLVKV